MGFLHVVQKEILHRLTRKFAALCHFFWPKSIADKAAIVSEDSHKFHCDHVTTQ